MRPARLLTLALASALVLPALADELPEPTPQVFTIVVSPTATPKPVYKEPEELPYYSLDDGDIEILCRLLWSSPLRSDSQKTLLLWCVFRRVEHGAPFGDSISEVVNDSEFTFYDKKARVSDANKSIVRRELTRWYASLDGYGIGRKPPKNALYCRFTGQYNRTVELMADPHGKALEW